MEIDDKNKKVSDLSLYELNKLIDDALNKRYLATNSNNSLNENNRESKSSDISDSKMSERKRKRMVIIANILLSMILVVLLAVMLFPILHESKLYRLLTAIMMLTFYISGSLMRIKYAEDVPGDVRLF